MTPLYLLTIVFPEFDPLTTSGMALYQMSQSVKIYLANTEHKWNLIPLILSISGNDFSLYGV
jgi:hypothetical protein